MVKRGMGSLIRIYYLLLNLLIEFIFELVLLFLLFVKELRLLFDFHIFRSMIWIANFTFFSIFLLFISLMIHRPVLTSKIMRSGASRPRTYAATSLFRLIKVQKINFIFIFFPLSVWRSPLVRIRLRIANYIEIAQSTKRLLQPRHSTGGDCLNMIFAVKMFEILKFVRPIKYEWF